MSTLPDPTPTPARLSLVLLAYYVGIVLVITLAPFRFAVPEHARFVWEGGWFDVAANVLLFVPLGFLYPLTRPAGRGWPVAEAAVLGVLLSGAVEATQLFERERYASGLDLLANGAGAWAGALAQRAVARRIRVNARLVGRLSLELPLMGLVYLLVPLLWLGTLTAQESPLRVFPLLLLGLFGGRVLTGLQRHHFGPAGALGARGVAGVAGAGMLVGIFPAVILHPLPGALAVITVAGVAGYVASRPEEDPSPDRRFEVRTLLGAAPYFGAYLLATMLVPLTARAGTWSWWVGFSGRSTSLGIPEQLALLESVAALTVLGYLLAELRSRRELPYGTLAPRLAAECGVAAAALELARGFQPAWGASVAQLLLLVGAGLLGGWIYHLQRDHVRSLAAEGAGAVAFGAPRPSAARAANL